ncbi:conjugal transfer protein TraF [candidate division CSSED10-310 bacterium]|uniref:Conjugal transfer protein TraF n=1 Tax=candidate division CSSED10-310 bacterium TaxID=2855610 RepID=A0ABV6YWC6_UNCC1
MTIKNVERTCFSYPKPIIILLFLMLIPLPTFATNFALVGTRATGMGGAAVSNPDGAYAIYWNPGKHFSGSYWNLVLPSGGFHVEQHNDIIKHLEDMANILREYDIGDEKLSNNSEVVQRLRPIIYKMDQQGTGLVSDFHAGCLLTLNRVKVGYLGLAFGGVSFIMDTVNLDVDGEDVENPITENESVINSWAIYTHQMILGYTQPLFDFESAAGKKHLLSLGLTAKYIHATTYVYHASIYEKYIDEITRDVEFDYQEEQSSNGSLDVGLHYNINNTWQFGLLFRDCTSPEFKTAVIEGSSRETVELPFQSRAGFSYHHPSDFTIAFDFDLTENDSSTLDGYKDRRLGLGLEKSIFNGHLTLRTGYYHNIAESGFNSVITVGLAARIKPFRIDASLGISPGNYGSEDIFYIDETVAAFHISLY